MILLILIFMTLALLGMPLFALMGSIAMLLFFRADIDLAAVAIEMYRLANSPTLITIPLFTLAGYFLAESKSPQRLLLLFASMFRGFPGSLALIALIISAIFTAFTGASGITIVALGGLLYPILLQHGYSDKFSIGLVTTTGSLGLLLPPSLPLILYGIVAKVDIDQLFWAGLVPCLILILFLATYGYLQEKKIPLKVQKSAINMVPLKKALFEARYELPLPFIILGGLYGGFLTTSETATLTLVYVLVMIFFLYRDLNFKRDALRICQESMGLVGAILLILCCAMGLTNYLVDEQIPAQLLMIVKEHIHNKYVFLLVLNLFLLVVGCMMDIFSAIIVVLPLIIPMSLVYEIHPLHLAIIFLTNLEIGYITPPVGVNLFISSYRFNRPIMELYKASLPFLVVLLLALLLITYVPFLSLVFA